MLTVDVGGAHVRAAWRECGVGGGVIYQSRLC
jgi:hypothetical protein